MNKYPVKRTVEAVALIAVSLGSSACEAMDGDTIPPDTRSGRTVSGTIQAPTELRTSPVVLHASDGTNSNGCYELKESSQFTNGTEIIKADDPNGNWIEIKLSQLPPTAQDACDNRAVVYIAESHAALDS